jgi:hypothetical protein
LTLVSFCLSFLVVVRTETADKCTEMSSSYPTTAVHQFASLTQMEHQKLHINDRIVRENSRLPPDGREYPTQINSNIEKQTSTSLKTKRYVKFIVIVSFSFLSYLFFSILKKFKFFNSFMLFCRHLHKHNIFIYKLIIHSTPQLISIFFFFFSSFNSIFYFLL